jgi:rhodanese-related sulfurtransferase
MVQDIDGKKLKEMIDNEGDELEIIDVREKGEYDEIRIKNSKLIPMAEVGSRIDEIDWDKKVVFVCRSGARSGYIAEMLAQNGKDSINLSGGVYELNLDQCDCLEKE